MKKVLALILSLYLIFGTLTIGSSAASADETSEVPVSSADTDSAIAVGETKIFHTANAYEKISLQLCPVKDAVVQIRILSELGFAEWTLKRGTQDITADSDIYHVNKDQVYTLSFYTWDDDDTVTVSVSEVVSKQVFLSKTETFTVDETHPDGFFTYTADRDGAVFIPCLSSLFLNISIYDSQWNLAETVLSGYCPSFIMKVKSGETYGIRFNVRDGDGEVSFSLTDIVPETVSIGETKSFSSSSNEHVKFYRFTADTDSIIYYEFQSEVYFHLVQYNSDWEQTESINSDQETICLSVKAGETYYFRITPDYEDVPVTLTIRCEPVEDIALSETKTVSLTDGKSNRYYRFTPEQDMLVCFYSGDANKGSGRLYNSSMSSSYDAERETMDTGHFAQYYLLDEGMTYFFLPESDSSDTDEFHITLKGSSPLSLLEGEKEISLSSFEPTIFKIQPDETAVVKYYTEDSALKTLALFDSWNSELIQESSQSVEDFFTTDPYQQRYLIIENNEDRDILFALKAHKTAKEIQLGSARALNLEPGQIDAYRFTAEKTEVVSFLTQDMTDKSLTLYHSDGSVAQKGSTSVTYLVSEGETYFFIIRSESEKLNTSFTFDRVEPETIETDRTYNKVGNQYFRLVLSEEEGLMTESNGPLAIYDSRGIYVTTLYNTQNSSVLNKDHAVLPEGTYYVNNRCSVFNIRTAEEIRPLEDKTVAFGRSGFFKYTTGEKNNVLKYYSHDIKYGEKTGTEPSVLLDGNIFTRDREIWEGYTLTGRRTKSDGKGIEENIDISFSTDSSTTYYFISKDSVRPTDTEGSYEITIAPGKFEDTYFTIDSYNSKTGERSGRRVVKYFGDEEETHFPDSVTDIAYAAFKNCDSLKKVTIPQTFTSIGFSAFENCDNIEFVTLPETEKEVSVSAYAFFDCPKLSWIIIPKNITSIGSFAFGYVTKDRLTQSYETVPGFTVYGYKDTEAERYAEEHGLIFVDIEEHPITPPTELPTENPDENPHTVTDPDTDISVSAPGEYELDVKPLDPRDFTLVKRRAAAAYDISLTHDGQEIRPDGSVIVKIPCQTPSARVYHIGQDQSQTDMNAVYEDGYLTFKTDHFSIYIVAEEMLLGDADGDGKVTVIDVTCIQKKLASLSTPVYYEDAADTDGDTKVTIVDATLIQKWLANLPSNNDIGNPLPA